MSKTNPVPAVKTRSAAQSDRGRSFLEVELPLPPCTDLPYSYV